MMPQPLSNNPRISALFIAASFWVICKRSSLARSRIAAPWLKHPGDMCCIMSCHKGWRVGNKLTPPFCFASYLNKIDTTKFHQMKNTWNILRTNTRLRFIGTHSDHTSCTRQEMMEELHWEKGCFHPANS